MKRAYFIVVLTVFVFFQSCKKKAENNIEIDYYENGNIKSIKSFKAGKLNGQCTWFYPDGMIKDKLIYKNGLANGNAHYFYESGALKNHRFFRDNKRVGYVADFFDDTVGMIKSVLLFNNNGNLIYRKNFDSLGNFINEEGVKPK